MEEEEDSTTWKLFICIKESWEKGFVGQKEVKITVKTIERNNKNKDDALSAIKGEHLGF